MGGPCELGGGSCGFGGSLSLGGPCELGVLPITPSAEGSCHHPPAEGQRSRGQDELCQAGPCCALWVLPWVLLWVQWVPGGGGAVGRSYAP